MEKLTLGKYSWITYSELEKRVEDVGSGFAKFAGVKAKDKVIIYADTKADWLARARIRPGRKPRSPPRGFLKEHSSGR